MVHLFRGRGFARPPMLGPRHMRPHGFEPDFIPPYGLPRGRPNFISRPPMRPRALPPPRMVGLHPPLPPRPRLLPPHIPPRDMPLPHIHPLGIIPPPGPPMGRPIRPQLPFRGRGMFPKRGMPLKRLVSSNGVQVKKNQKRKEKTEEMEINKPWVVTEALKSEIHKKYVLYEIAKEKKTDSDWQAYKEQRILVGKMINTAKLEYIGSHPEADVDKIMFGATPKGMK